MTDRTGFSLEMTIDPASGFQPLPDLVACDLCNAYTMTNGDTLLHNTRTGKRAMVRPEVYASLVTCRQFNTLDEHVAQIIKLNQGMQGQQTDIRAVLELMLDSGMLVSARLASNELKRQPAEFAPVENPGRPVVTIITWERPIALERLLKSLASNCATEKFHQLFVIDDSRKPENINQNRELVAKFTRALKMPVQYFGQNEQQSLLGSLIARLPEHEGAIRFLADQSRWRDQWTSGLARNLALLLSCGRRLVMVDDDVVCDVYNPARQRPDVTFSERAREADFFSSEQEWSAQRQPINPDPIDRHMQCLGMSFAQALETLGSNNLKADGLRGATALQLSELHADSRVVITECGSLGCPGTSDNTGLPDIAPVSLKAMLASSQKTTNALNTRLVWSGRQQPHFSPQSNISQITGFDNRQLLPPYFPILRGEDRLFGLMVSFILPDALTLDYPWAVPHLPIPPRNWLDKDRDFTPGASFPIFFWEQIQMHKSICLAQAPAERLAALAALYSDLAAAKTESLIERHRDFVLRNTSEQLQHLDALLQTADNAPDAWRSYLEKGIDQLTNGLDQASLEQEPIKGVPAPMEGDELVVFWRNAWSGFAEALRAWPDIRATAAELLQAQTPR